MVSHAREVPNLHFDIITMIMDLLAKNDLLSMTMVCKQLQKPANTLLLRNGVALADSHAVASFARFMAQDCSRFRHLFSIKLPEIIDGPDRAHVVEILRQSAHLRSLHVRTPRLLDSDRRILAQIAALPDLRRLAHNGPETISALRELFASLVSPIEAVDIRKVNDDSEGSHIFTIDAVAFFTGFASSLRELRLPLAPIPDTVSLQPLSLVKTLELYRCQELDVQGLFKLFPNLNELVLPLTTYEAPDVPRSFEWGFFMRRCQVHREMNVAVPPTSRWPKLQRVAGTLHLLWALGLTCPVEKVHILADCANAAQDSVLYAVMADMKPCELRMEYTLVRANLEMLKHMFEACDGSLTSLEITLRHDDTDWMSVAALLVCCFCLARLAVLTSEFIGRICTCAAVAPS